MENTLLSFADSYSRSIFISRSVQNFDGVWPTVFMLSQEKNCLHSRRVNYSGNKHSGNSMCLSDPTTYPPTHSIIRTPIHPLAYFLHRKCTRPFTNLTCMFVRQNYGSILVIYYKQIIIYPGVMHYDILDSVYRFTRVITILIFTSLNKLLLNWSI